MSRYYQRAEIVTLLKVDEDFIAALEAEDLVHADDDGYPDFVVERIRIARTMVHELEVNVAGVAVALELMRQLEQEREHLRAVMQLLREQSATQPADTETEDSR